MDPIFQINDKIVDDMSLIVCLKATDGFVLASDSRTVYADWTYEDKSSKVFSLNKYSACALAGDIDYILPVIEDFQNTIKAQNNLGVTDVAKLLANRIVNDINNPNSKVKLPALVKALNMGDPNFGLVIAGYDKNGHNGFTIKRMFSYNLTSPFPVPITGDYYTEGAKTLAKYLLKKNYSIPKTVKEATELAKYVISETAKNHLGVGGKINILNL